MSRPTVLSLVNRLKIEQDKAHQLYQDSENLIHRAQAHLDSAHATLIELAELQGIAVPHTDLSGIPDDAPSFTPSNPLDRPPYVPRDGSGPQHIMSLCPIIMVLGRTTREVTCLTGRTVDVMSAPVPVCRIRSDLAQPTGWHGWNLKSLVSAHKSMVSRKGTIAWA